MKQQFFAGRALGYGSALLALLLCGCAKVNDMGLLLVSSSEWAFLSINGQRLNGAITLVPDRTGRVSFAVDEAVKNATISSCSGGMRYTATYSAEVALYCNDGTQVIVKATLISETRGYGYGSTPQGPVSFAFGMPEAEAYAFMGRAAPEVPAQTP